MDLSVLLFHVKVVDNLQLVVVYIFKLDETYSKRLQTAGITVKECRIKGSGVLYRGTVALCTEKTAERSGV